MTKKHFEAIAHTLDANMAPLHLVSDFADMCEEFSTTFDRQTFIVAATGNLRKQQEHDARLLDNATKN